MIPQGRVPTGIELTNFSVFVSITATVPPRPVVTYSFDPSGETSTSIGSAGDGMSIVLVTVRVAVSTTVTLCSASAGT